MFDKHENTIPVPDKENYDSIETYEVFDSSIKSNNLTKLHFRANKADNQVKEDGSKGSSESSGESSSDESYSEESYESSGSESEGSQSYSDESYERGNENNHINDETHSLKHRGYDNMVESDENAIFSEESNEEEGTSSIREVDLKGIEDISEDLSEEGSSSEQKNLNEDKENTKYVMEEEHMTSGSKRRDGDKKTKYEFILVFKNFHLSARQSFNYNISF